MYYNETSPYYDSYIHISFYTDQIYLKQNYLSNNSYIVTPFLPENFIGKDGFDCDKSISYAFQSFYSIINSLYSFVGNLSYIKSESGYNLLKYSSTNKLLYFDEWLLYKNSIVTTNYFAKVIDGKITNVIDLNSRVPQMINDLWSHEDPICIGGEIIYEDSIIISFIGIKRKYESYLSTYRGVVETIDYINEYVYLIYLVFNIIKKNEINFTT